MAQRARAVFSRLHAWRRWKIAAAIPSEAERLLIHEGPQPAGSRDIEACVRPPWKSAVLSTAYKLEEQIPRRRYPRRVLGIGQGGFCAGGGGAATRCRSHQAIFTVEKAYPSARPAKTARLAGGGWQPALRTDIWVTAR